MHALFKKIAVFTSDIEQILNRQYPTPQRGQLLRDYIRIRIKASLNRWFHFTHEHFLSNTIVFPDYEIFFVELRQIFIRRAYYIPSKHNTPRIIDAGGNLGLATLYFKYLYPDAVVTVFEPSRETLSSIEKNITQKGISGITLEKKAIGSSDGVATMYSRGAAACGNTLVGVLAEQNKEKSSGERYDVPVTRLSPYIGERLDALKLDIEGSEGWVLHELEVSGALARIQYIVMEYHPGTGIPENNLGTIIGILERNGFRVEPFSEDPIVEYTISIRAFRS